MSLKKFRSKQEFIDHNFDYDVEYYSWWTRYDEYDEWDYWDYWDCDYCGISYCQHYSHCSNYNYIDVYDLDWLVKRVGGNGRIFFEDASLGGNYINMDSIYRKEVKRDIKIDILLGLRKSGNYRPTLGDIINKNIE